MLARTRIRWKQLLAVGLMILSSSSCAHFEPMHSGVVVDHETKKPLNDVVVTMHLGSRGFFGSSMQEDSYEGSSGSKGWFYVAPRWKWTQPLEFFTTQELYFHKAGYFTARILDPAIREKIDLHRVQYLSDFHEYQKQAEDNMSLHFVSRDEKKNVLFAKEMEKIRGMTAVPAGEPGVFAEVPGSAMTRVVCTTYGVNSPFSAHRETFAVTRFPCSAFDQARQRWVYLTPEGRTKNVPFSPPADRELITWNKELMPVVFANRTSIYDPTTFKPPRTIKPEKGNITSVAGNWFSLLSVEEKGKYVCNYPLPFPKQRSCTAIDADGSGGSRMLALSKFYEGPSNIFYGLSQYGEDYIVHKIADSDDYGRPVLGMTQMGRIHKEASFRAFLAAPGGRVFYLLLENGLRKLSPGEGGLFQEDKAFTNAFHSLPFASNIKDFAVQNGLLYVVTGDDKIYRVLEDGSPDFKIAPLTGSLSPGLGN